MRSCGKCVDGMVEVGGKAYECECALLPRLAAQMPAHIRSTPVERAHIEHPVTRMVDRNLFMKAAWLDMRAIIKVVYYKYHNLYIRVTSDNEIKDVGVGSTSRKAMGDDAAVVYNSLSDLMTSPKLVIVWLNKLGYKNKAAPGYLEEALNVRSDYGLPTWAFSDLNRPFGPGSFAYSESVWDLLHSAFLPVEIPRIATAHLAGPAVGRPEAVSNAAGPQREIARPERGIRPSPDEDADAEARPSKVAAYGQGLSSKGGRRRGN